MKFTKKALTGAVAATVLASGAVAPLAQAEISASVGIASTYLWRGYELGSGIPVVSGDLSYSNSGFYAGMWTSSGDGSAGTEYDLYLGYGGSAGNFSYDFFVVSYVYPTGPYSETDGMPGDFMEVVGTLGFGPVSFTMHQNVAGDTGGYAFTTDYRYFALGLELNDFSFALGMHDEGFEPDGEIVLPIDDDTPLPVTFDAIHFDATYAYNENLSFTLSTILSSDASDYGLDDPKPTFVVSYSLPLSL